jgi:hypothetical protein
LRCLGKDLAVPLENVELVRKSSAGELQDRGAAETAVQALLGNVGSLGLVTTAGDKKPVAGKKGAAGKKPAAKHLLK